MSRLLPFAAVLAALAAAPAAASATAYVPGQVVVKYRDGTSRQARAAAQHSTGLHAPRVTSRLERTLRLQRGRSMAETLRALRARPDVEYAVPNYVAHASEINFNDPGRSDGVGWATLQWNFLPGTGIDAPTGWQHLIDVGRPGALGTVIAVLDTGVAYRNFHRYRLSTDFSKGQFVQGFDFCARDGRDEACVGHDRYPVDENGHGTHVASTIGEQVNNGIGVTGLAYGAKIMPVRVLNSRGEGDAVAIASGIRYAAKNGADVINLSLEFSSDISHASQIPEIIHALRYAAKKNVVIVGASGNEAETAVAYPARATPVISVGAVTEHGCQADYSNDGVGLDIVAPGGGADARVREEINCKPFTDPGRDIYQWTYDGSIRRFGLPGGYEGTSMAAPHVSAVAAMIIASGVLGTNISPRTVEARLEQTARDLGPVGYDTRYGAGVVDAGRATDPAIPALP
jgi:serine protease